MNNLNFSFFQPIKNNIKIKTRKSFKTDCKIIFLILISVLNKTTKLTDRK